MNQKHVGESIWLSVVEPFELMVRREGQQIKATIVRWMVDSENDERAVLAIEIRQDPDLMGTWICAARFRGESVEEMWDGKSVACDCVVNDGLSVDSEQHIAFTRLTSNRQMIAQLFLQKT